MSGRNGSEPDVTTALEEILRPLERAHERLLDQHEKLLAQAQAVKVEMQRIEKVLRAAAPPRPTRGLAAPRRHQRVSEERRQMILDKLATFKGGAIVSELATAAGVSTGSVNYALAELRERELVRKAGLRQPPEGTTGRASTVWKAVDRGA